MERNEDIIDNLYTAVHIGELEEVKRITRYLLKTFSWYPDYNLLCISFLHKHINIARFFLSLNCEVIGDSRKNYRGNSALHSAVLYGDSSLVRTILQKGASHSSRNVDGLVPLHLIVYRNPAISRSPLSPEQFDKESSKIIDALLEFGVNINVVVNSHSKYGYTSLHLAAECGNEKIITFLLQKKANFNAKSELGVTPLHVAVSSENFGIVNLLLKRGVTVYSKDNRAKTPLCWAIEQGQTGMIEILLNHNPPAHRNKFKYIPTLKDDHSAILTAVKMDNLAIVESLLNKGAFVNAFWKNGTIPLHIAVENGSEGIIQILLDHGADVTAVAMDGKTPLYIAVERGWTRIIEILLNCVPEINSTLTVPDIHGSTPFNLAVKKGSEEIIKLLLQKGVQPSFNSQCQESPLHTAVLKNRVKILKILLLNGIDVDAKDKFGRTALQAAVGQGSSEIVQAFCDIYSKREEKWKEGYVALYIAAREGRETIVKLLLEKGADLNARNENYLTPLYAAAEKGHVNIVKLFLENGVDVNEIRNDGRTALHCAVEKQFYKVVECLLENGANVNVQVSGDSPLHFAAGVGNLNIVKLLLNKGADVNAKNLSDATPLLIAVQRNWQQIVNYLVENGADVNIKDQDSTIKSFNYSSDCIHDLRSCRGLRPLVVAVDNCNLEVVEILLKNGSPTDIKNERISPLHLASANGSLEIVKKLLKFGANINSVCEQKYTPLSHAIANGKTETFVCLLSNGVNFRKNSGNSVLHIALSSAKKDESIVELLLDFGADAKATTVDNKTPLHCAISFGNGKEQKNLFKLLLDYGSEVNAREKVGNTPLHIAAREGDFEAAEVILDYGADINAINKEGNTALKYLVDSVEDDLILHLYNSNSRTCPYAIIAKSIVSLIAVRESLGKRVNQKNLELVKSEKFKDFYERCKRELAEMNREEVVKKISFYDILAKSNSELAFCVGNTAVAQTLESENLKEKFPCYAAMLTSRARMAKERRKLTESSEKQLKAILKIKFPCLIVHEIFSYLSSADMKNMARVFQRPGQSLSKFLNRSR